MTWAMLALKNVPVMDDCRQFVTVIYDPPNQSEAESEKELTIFYSPASPRHQNSQFSFGLMISGHIFSLLSAL